jgi:hypothetical protein
MINGLSTQVVVAGRTVLRCPRIEIETRRHMPLSMARLVLPDPGGELIQAWSAGDPVQLQFGYRDQSPGQWDGTIESIGADGKDRIEVRAVGQERPSSDTRIIQTFENEDPAAIIRFAVSASGLPVGRIDSPGVIFPRFVASDATVWAIAVQCAHTCRHGFGLDMSRWALWLGADGVNWGDFDEPGQVPVVATGAGLIRHSPGGGAYGRPFVVTFLIPSFVASMVFRLRDQRRGVDSLIRAQTVVHSITPDLARTCIEYGDEYVRS